MISERLQEALRFWWRHLPAIALVVIPFSLLNSAAVLAFGPPLSITEGQATDVNGITLGLIFVLRTLAEAALIAQLAAIVGGQARGLGDCALLAVRVAPAMLLCNLIVVSAVSAAFMLLILPAVWLYIRLSLATFSVVLENVSAGAALRLSVMRTQAQQWQLLGAWLLLAAAVLFASLIMTALLQSVAGNHAGIGVVMEMITTLGVALLQVLLFRYYGLARDRERQNTDL
jgi:hypothetical protein